MFESGPVLVIYIFILYLNHPCAMDEEQDLGFFLLCRESDMLCTHATQAYFSLEKEILQICNPFKLLFRCVEITVAKRSVFSPDV